MDAHQLSLRRNGIGGSDIAAICGYSQWGGPIDVYMSKTGMIDNSKTLVYQSVGQLLEPAIVRIFERETGLKTKEVPYPGIYTSTQEPWHIMSPDSFLADENTGLEVKNVGIENSYLWGSGEEEIPTEYFLQVHWYIRGFQVDYWYVIALVGGNQPKIYKIYKNETLENELVERARSFWYDHVLSQIPPPIDDSEAAATLLAKLHPDPSEDILPVTDPMVHAWVSTLQQAEEDIKKTTAIKEGVKNHLRQRIGDYSGIEGQLDDKTYRILWSKPRNNLIIDYDKLLDDLLKREDFAPHRPTEELLAKHTAVFVNSEAIVRGLSLPDGFVTPYTTIRQGPRVFRAYFDVKPKKKKGTKRGTNRKVNAD